MFKVYIYIYAYIYIIYIYMLMLGFWHVQQLHEVCIYIYTVYTCVGSRPRSFKLFIDGSSKLLGRTGQFDWRADCGILIL